MRHRPRATLPALSLLAAIFAAAVPAAGQPAATTKPNILVIFGDDIGWFNPSAYHRGTMGYETPNIDRKPASFNLDEVMRELASAKP